MDISPITDKNGSIKIAALDHRGSLKKILPEDKLSDFKTLCTKEFAPYSTAVLLDPEYGEKAAKIAQKLSLSIIFTAEKTGYTDSSKGRLTELHEDFNAQKVNEIGASAIKLLLYYNPDAPNKDTQKLIAERAKIEAQKNDLPVLLEIITYQIEDITYSKEEAILRSIRELRDFGDILKLEFPITIIETNQTNDFAHSKTLLEQMTSEAQKPWVLLSRGMKFNLFKEALNSSIKSGAAGFAVGRAVWQEIANYNTWEEQENFIKTTAKQRMKELTSLLTVKQTNET